MSKVGVIGTSAIQVKINKILDGKCLEYSNCTLLDTTVTVINHNTGLDSSVWY